MLKKIIDIPITNPVPRKIIFPSFIMEQDYESLETMIVGILNSGSNEIMVSDHINQRKMGFTDGKYHHLVHMDKVLKNSKETWKLMFRNSEAKKLFAQRVNETHAIHDMEERCEKIHKGLYDILLIDLVMNS